MKEYVPNTQPAPLLLFSMLQTKALVRPRPMSRPLAPFYTLRPTEWRAVTFDQTAPLISTLAEPLTAQAVVIANQETGRAIVYHPGATFIDRALFPAFAAEFGQSPPSALCAVYAVRGEWSQVYFGDFAKLRQFGIPDDNLVFIRNVKTYFGVSNRGMAVALG